MINKVIIYLQKLKFAYQDSNKTSNSGAAMIAVVFVTLILLVIILALINMILTEVKIVHNDQHATQALYIAEAGAELGINYLYSQPSYRGELLNVTSFKRPYDFGGGQINSILIQSTNGKVEIISEGEVEKVTRKIYLTLTVMVLEDEDNFEIIINRENWDYKFN